MKNVRYKEFLNEHSGASELHLDLLTYLSSSELWPLCSRSWAFLSNGSSVLAGCQIPELAPVVRKKGASLPYFF